METCILASFFDKLTDQLGSQSLTKLAGRLGADEAATKAAASAAIPAILGALGKNAGSPGGAASLLGALNKKHDGHVVDDVDGYLDDPDEDDGDGILGHALGENRGGVTNQIQQLSGLGGGQADQLLKMLAPLVMGALGKQANGGGLDAAGLAKLLQGDQAKAVLDKLPGGLGDLLGNPKSGAPGGAGLPGLGSVLGKLGKR